MAGDLVEEGARQLANGDAAEWDGGWSGELWGAARVSGGVLEGEATEELGWGCGGKEAVAVWNGAVESEEDGRRTP